MGLLTSVLNLAFVAAAGWFTIYYLVPKLTGETTTAAADTADGSGSEEADIQKALEDTLAGLTGDDTTTPESDTPVPPKGSKIVSPKEKKKRSEESIYGGAGKEGRKGKKGKKGAKTEYRYFYLSGDYY